MTREKSGLNRLCLIVVTLGVIGTATGAHAQLQSPPATTAEPTVHDARVRPRNDQTDGNFTQTLYAGKSSFSSDVKRIRTTRERITDGSAPPAVAPLQPPPAKP